MLKNFFNGIDFVLALTYENQVYSWGRNDHGQLGIGCVKDNRFYEPQLIEFCPNVKIVQVCCGERHSLVLIEEGVVYGWGDNTYGQTGCGQQNQENVVSPTKWFIDCKVSKIYCSRYQSFAITNDGNVYFCGRKDHCEFAEKYGQSYKVFAPKLLENIDNIQEIITSNKNTYFVTKGMEIYFIGFNDKCTKLRLPISQESPNMNSYEANKTF